MTDAAVVADHRTVFGLWGGEAEVTLAGGPCVAAVSEVRRTIDLVERACSTFDDTSDISTVNARAGHWVTVDDVLVQILGQTVELAAATGGALDPTVGTLTISEQSVPVSRRADYRLIEMRGSRVRIPSGVALDLNSTAKAWCADTAATRAARISGSGVLVGLLGDISVAGRGRWTIACGDDHRHVADDATNTICITGGAVATSSTTVRRSPRGSHLLDPATLRPVAGPWRTASVCAATCMQANAAATAALVKGRGAAAWLESLRLPARLVHNDGRIHTTEGWPS